MAGFVIAVITLFSIVYGLDSKYDSRRTPVDKKYVMKRHVELRTALEHGAIPGYPKPAYFGDFVSRPFPFAIFKAVITSCIILLLLLLKRTVDCSLTS